MGVSMFQYGIYHYILHSLLNNIEVMKSYVCVYSAIVGKTNRI